MMKIIAAQGLSSTALQRLQKELSSLVSEPLEDIEVSYNDFDITKLCATITGPEGTPFEDGRFKMRLHFGQEYPLAAPRAHFLTKIFHPNVDPKTGAICVNTLNKDWLPDLGVRHILIVIRCLMIDPNPESALNEEAGFLLRNHYDEYVVRARLITDIHARPPEAAIRSWATTSGRATSNGIGNGGVTKKAAKDSKKMLRRL